MLCEKCITGYWSNWTVLLDHGAYGPMGCWAMDSFPGPMGCGTIECKPITWYSDLFFSLTGMLFFCSLLCEIALLSMFHILLEHWQNASMKQLWEWYDGRQLLVSSTMVPYGEFLAPGPNLNSCGQDCWKFGEVSNLMRRNFYDFGARTSS